jgi:hypothetical protein
MFDFTVSKYNTVVYIYIYTCLTAWNIDNIKFAISYQAKTV